MCLTGLRAWGEGGGLAEGAPAFPGPLQGLGAVTQKQRLRAPPRLSRPCPVGVSRRDRRTGLCGHAGSSEACLCSACEPEASVSASPAPEQGGVLSLPRLNHETHAPQASSARQLHAPVRGQDGGTALALPPSQPADAAPRTGMVCVEGGGGHGHP